ncbi:MAG: hypothetical protein WAN35_13875 [Terracidiphilus sp.]
MPAPLRGTQSLIGQMSWVFVRPSLTAIEVGWRWTFGLPLVLVAMFEANKILIKLPPVTAGLTTLDPQNPWVAATQLRQVWALYMPHIAAVLHWLLPVAALAWIIISGLGRSLIFKQMEPRLPFRPVAMFVLQAAWLLGFVFTGWAWLHAMHWVAATHITPNAEPDLIGFAVWAIFLSLGFFAAWALTSWALSVAPLIMLLEGRSALSALGQTLRLGKPMTAKLVEINMVMGIVNLALIVLAMVLSAAPLPFSDQLGTEALHVVWTAAAIFYFVASDAFQVVRLKGFHEFWIIYRFPQASMQDTAKSELE